MHWARCRTLQVRLSARGTSEWGGYDDTTQLSSAEVFDSTTGTWSALPNMKQKREYCTAVVIGCCIYVMGGHGEDLALHSVEMFDTTTNTWTDVPDMPYSSYMATVVSM